MAKVKVNSLSQKEQFSLAVRTLSDKGFDNEQIADLMFVTRKQVGAVMAWHKHRDSWN